MTDNVQKHNIFISLGCYELKQHEPWFDEECSKLLAQRKLAKLQWLQDSLDGVSARHKAAT
jgi:hypothetical protein